MGYRSDVAIVLTQKHYNLLFEAANNADLPKISKDWLIEFLSDTKKQNVGRKTYVLITEEWITWDSYVYPEIGFIEDFLRTHKHAFIRIGESDDDVESEFKIEDNEGRDENFYDLICVTRSISMQGFN